MKQAALDVFTRLNLSFEPELLHFVTLSGQEVLDFQLEMYGDPSYTEMGSPYRLTEGEDACYLEFTFSMDGVPVYSPEARRASFADGVMSPYPVSASMILTEEGIRHFYMVCASTAEPDGVPQPLLSPEKAAQALKEKYDLEIHFGEIVFDRVYLEYIPVMDGDESVLKPYWCFDSPDLAERINAITGEDLTYGG